MSQERNLAMNAHPSPKSSSFGMRKELRPPYFWRDNAALCSQSLLNTLHMREVVAHGYTYGSEGLYGKPHGLDSILQGHRSFIERLQCDDVLRGHQGCVNHLQWNQTGTLLASGSDDTNIIVWDYATKKKLETIQTNHRLNIFAVCFVPGTNDHIIASGAMDCDVRIHYAPFHADTNRVMTVHSGRVKDIASSPGAPQIFWSVAEDGIVFQFDVRNLPEPSQQRVNGNGLSSGAIICLGKKKRHSVLRGMGMTVHPLDPNIIAVACGDYYSRLYDRRMLRVVKYDGRSGEDSLIDATQPVEVFAPPHAHFGMYSSMRRKSKNANLQATSIQFNSNGSEILTNYHSDHIYLYRVGYGSHPKSIFSIPEISNAIRPGWKNGMYMDRRLGQKLTWSPHELRVVQEKGIKLFSEDQYTKAIDSLTTAIDADSSSPLSSETMQNLYKTLAKAYTCRNWGADSYLAAVYCRLALELNPNDREVESLYLKALWRGERGKHCAFMARQYQHKYPEHSEDADEYLRLGSEDSQPEDRERRRSSTSASSDSTVDMTVHLESYPGLSERVSDDRHSNEDARSIDSASERHRESLDAFTKVPEADDDFYVGPKISNLDVNCDVLHRYIGYANTQTDIKEATFFGPNDAFIVAGSDDGYAYIWDKSSGKLVTALHADADIVNCLQCHPFDTCLATSGIEHVIRLWTPTSEDCTCPNEQSLLKLVEDNQKSMRREVRSHFFASDSSDVIRLLFTRGEAEGVQECLIS